MYYIKLKLVEKYGDIQEEVVLYTDVKRTDSEVNNLIRKYKKEYADNLKGRHYKWEAYEYTKNKLIENEGFKEMLEFNF